MGARLPISAVAPVLTVASARRPGCWIDSCPPMVEALVETRRSFPPSRCAGPETGRLASGIRAGDCPVRGGGCHTFDTFFTCFEGGRAGWGRQGKGLEAHFLGGRLGLGFRAEDRPARRGECLTLSQCVTQIGRQGIGDRVWGMQRVGDGRLRSGVRAVRSGGCLTFDMFFTRFGGEAADVSLSTPSS